MSFNLKQHFLYVSSHYVALFNSEECLWQKTYDTPFWELEIIEPISIPNLSENAHIRVLLSSDFFRFLLIPWSSELQTKDNIRHYALANFKNALGSNVNPLSIQVAVQHYEKPFLATHIQDNIIARLSIFTQKLLPDVNIISYEPAGVTLADYIGIKNGLFILNDLSSIVSFYYENSTLVDIETHSSKNSTSKTVEDSIHRQLLRLGKQHIDINYCQIDATEHSNLAKDWQIISLQELLAKKKHIFWNEINLFYSLHINYYPIQPFFLKKKPLLIFALLLLVFFLIPISNISQQKTELKFQQNSFKQTLIGLNEELKSDKQIYIQQARIAQLNAILKPRKIAWDKIYGELEVLNYENIRILRIDINSENNSVEITAEAKTLKAANVYLANMQNSDAFINPVLVRHLKQVNAVPQVVNFVIRSNIRY